VSSDRDDAISLLNRARERYAAAMERHDWEGASELKNDTIPGLEKLLRDIEEFEREYAEPTRGTPDYYAQFGYEHLDIHPKGNMFFSAYRIELVVIFSEHQLVVIHEHNLYDYPIAKVYSENNPWASEEDRVLRPRRFIRYPGRPPVQTSKGIILRAYPDDVVGFNSKAEWIASQQALRSDFEQFRWHIFGLVREMYDTGSSGAAPPVDADELADRIIRSKR
jgi:hypothetical protein